MNRLLLIAGILLLGTQLVPQAAAQSAESIPFSSPEWRIEGEDHSIVLYQGREAVRLKGASAVLPAADFDTGTIEFSIAFPHERGFQGIFWHLQDDQNYEEFYMRSHLSGMSDANQYSPVLGGISAWQLYHGEGYSAAVDYTHTWMRVKMVIGETAGEIYIDSDEPQIHFTRKGNLGAGIIGVYASGLNTAYFSDFSIRRESEPLRSEAPVFDPPAEGTVVTWDVAGPFVAPEEAGSLDMPDLSDASWRTLGAEEKGITNLAMSPGEGEGRVMAARVVIDADRAKTTTALFGYSDKVTVLLNGQPLYRGNNTWVTRDYRYLGTIGLFDEVILPLERGRNELVFLVQEAFGGWGVMARITDTNGLRFDQGVIAR